MQPKLNYIADMVAELPGSAAKVYAPAVLSALCHWGFDFCASFELERWSEFILKAK